MGKTQPVEENGPALPSIAPRRPDLVRGSRLSAYPLQKIAVVDITLPKR